MVYCFFFYEITASTPQRGRVADVSLIGVYLSAHGGYIVLMSTDINLTEDEIVKLYSRRWNIETIFKTCKSTLKLEKRDAKYLLRWSYSSCHYNFYEIHVFIVF